MPLTLPALSDILSVVVCYTTVLFAAELLFCVPNLPHRPHFGARLLLLGPAFCTLLNVRLIEGHAGTWLMLPVALVVFLVSLAVLRVLFDATWKTLFFYGSAAYSVEGIILMVRRADYYFPGLSALDPLVVAACQVALCGAVVALVWRLLVRRYKDGGTPCVDNGHLLFFVGATLVVTDLLSTWVRAEGLSNPPYAFCSLLCYVLLLALEFDVFRVSAIEHERDLMRQLFRERERQQAASQQSIETVNVKFHDLKHQIAALRAMPDPAERDRSLDELERSIQMYDSSIKSGDPAIDAILTEKSMQCWGRGIEFTCMVDASCLADLGVVDAYTLLGNALDNAMEAAEGVPESEGRVISLWAGRRGDFSFVRIENSCVGLVPLVGGAPRTTKPDRVNHGFGLQSIRSVVERHGGNMVIDARDGSFELDVLLPACRP